MGNYTHDINDDLLVRYLLGEVNPEEVAMVRSWLESAPSHAAYFEQMRNAWMASRVLAPEQEPDEEAAWKRFQARIQNPASRSPRSFGWMRIAALFILVIGAGTIAWFTLFQSGRPRELVARAVEHVLADTLRDGSVVTLNKHSELVYPDRFAKKERRVKLRGEAFF